jgi:HK97 family phage major capsid protein
VDKELEELLKRLEAAQAVSKEQLEFLKTFWEAHPDAAPTKAQAARQIPFIDDDGLKGRIRRIDRILATSEVSKTRGINLLTGMPERPLTEEEKLIREFSDEALIVGTILGRNPRTLKMWGELSESTLGKALAEATAGSGAEWVPTLLSADFIEKFRLASKVAQLFPEIAMPSQPFDLPFIGGALTWYLVPESQSDEPSKAPASTITTGKRTLNAKKLKARTLFSEELTEDSILAVLPMLKDELITSGGEAIEDVLINGDTTAPHMDSDVTSALDRRKAWIGLRKLAITAATAKLDLSTFDKDTVRNLKTKMGKYGVTPADVAYIAGIVSYNKMLGLAELLTMEKYGALATIVTGELGRLYGSPVIISERMREDLNASGVYDATTMTYTGLLTVYRRGFVIGARGLAKVKFKGADQDPDSDQNTLSVSFRKAFLDRWAVSSTVVTAGYGYKIS